MNALDIVILALFIPGLVRGISKGFLEQVISLGGVFLSVYLAYRFSSVLCVWLRDYISVSDTVLGVISFSLILAGALILVIMLAKLITKAVEMASLGWFNRVLGIVFSFATTALVLATLAIIFDTLNVKFELVKSPVLTESVLYPALRDLGYAVFPYLKKLLPEVLL